MICCNSPGSEKFSCIVILNEPHNINKSLKAYISKAKTNVKSLSGVKID